MSSSSTDPDSVTSTKVDAALKALGIDAGLDFESLVIGPTSISLHRQDMDGNTTSTEIPIKRETKAKSRA